MTFSAVPPLDIWLRVTQRLWSSRIGMSPLASTSLRSHYQNLFERLLCQRLKVRFALGFYRGRFSPLLLSFEDAVDAHRADSDVLFSGILLGAVVPSLSLF